MLNCINIHGRLTRNPELKTIDTKSGSMAICEFSVAVNRSRDPDETDFFNCKAFGKTAEVIDKFFAKGQEILLNGTMQCEKYEGKDGKMRYPWRLIVNGFDFIGSKKDNDANRNIPEGFTEEIDDMPF